MAVPPSTPETPLAAHPDWSRKSGDSSAVRYLLRDRILMDSRESSIVEVRLQLQETNYEDHVFHTCRNRDHHQHRNFRAGAGDSAAQRESTAAHCQRRRERLADTSRDRESGKQRSRTEPRDTARPQTERWEFDQQREGASESPAESVKQEHLSR